MVKDAFRSDFPMRSADVASFCHSKNRQNLRILPTWPLREGRMLHTLSVRPVQPALIPRARRESNTPLRIAPAVNLHDGAVSGARVGLPTYCVFVREVVVIARVSRPCN